MNQESTDADAREFWEGRYGGAEQVWSGRVNKVVADVVAELEPGRALDLGCGEGGDAIWLARHGWHVTGVDVSTTAIARGAAAAQAAGVADRITWLATDLASWSEEGAAQRYDLVTASFFHSPLEFPRVDILRRAAGLLARGGHLLILSHGAMPPWSAHAHEEHHFPGPVEEVENLGLPESEFEVRLAETRSREATGPDGQRATLDDVVVLLRRR
jgi:SAM-dependent methyltransferase